MIDIITINIRDIISVRHDVPNFMIVHNFYQKAPSTSNVEDSLATKEDLNNFSPNSDLGYIETYSMYYKDGCKTEDVDELKDEYIGILKDFPKPYISDALDDIVQNILERLKNASEEDDGIDVICVAEENVASHLSSYLNSRFKKMNIESQSISLLRHVRIPNIKKLVISLKLIFGTKFIYPEDPVQFSHILRKYVEGMN